MRHPNQPPNQFSVSSSQPLPPFQSQGGITWLRRNLFKTWYDSLLTLVCLVFLVGVAIKSGQWLFGQAQWSVVQQNFGRFLVGRYPLNQSWRLVVLAALWLLAGLGILSSGFRQRLPLGAGVKKHLFSGQGGIALILGLWLVSLGLIGGGVGLPPVPNRLWGGLLLTLLIALVSIIAAFPLGILLALGRQSQLPMLKILSTLYIELVRGLPLIGILFMAQFMFPLLFPSSWQLTFDRLLRAVAGLVLFNAAYLAENVRGGLQAVPKGQIEAAHALGLNHPLTLGLIVLPQALRMAIPSIVGQFISLFKDTSLLSLFAILELTGMARSILAQPQFLGRYGEVYLLVAAIYWMFCFGMSRVSRKLERSR
jgi:general L-amino acid transport system permease protein